MASSSSKSALQKLARICSERLSVIKTVRKANEEKFQSTVTELVRANTFLPGECMALQIAKGVANEFGLSDDAVHVVPMHDGWVSAQFKLRVETPMPRPEGKRDAKQAPVVTETLYKVVKASGKLRIFRVKLPTDEKESNLGGEFMLKEYQRPSPPPPPQD